MQTPSKINTTFNGWPVGQPSMSTTFDCVNVKKAFVCELTGKAYRAPSPQRDSYRAYRRRKTDLFAHDGGQGKPAAKNDMNSE